MKSTDVISKYLSFGNRLNAYEPLLKNILDGRKKEFEHKLIDSNTYIGIEVEVENVHRSAGILSIAPDISLWRNTEDGSLRNHGREFVSLPIKGDEILLALSLLNETLTKEKTCIGHEFTDRTSVHIHMNVRDLTYEQLANLIITYILVEPLLYNVTGKIRGKGVFCVPITESTLQDTLGAFFKSYESGKDNTLDWLHNWQKYTGFNLLPMFQYGTIEFRHLYGTRDETTIIKWINLILSLKKFAISQSYDKLKQRVLVINTTSEYRHILQEIFGPLSKELEITELDKVLESTSIQLKNMFTFKEDRIIDLINAETKKEISTHHVELPFIKLCIARGIIQPYTIKDRIRESEELIRKLKSKKADLDQDLKSNQAFLQQLDKEKQKREFNMYKEHVEGLARQVITQEGKIQTELEKLANLKRGIVEEKKSQINPYISYDPFETLEIATESRMETMRRFASMSFAGNGFSGTTINAREGALDMPDTLVPTTETPEDEDF